MTTDTDMNADPGPSRHDDLDDGRSSPWPRRVAVLGIVIVVGLLAAYGTRFGTDPAVVDSPLIGQPAPDFDLPLLEGEGTRSLADLDGDIVIVNFWASWCVPCREEHPDLLAAAERYRDDGVTFLGIVYQDRPDAAIGFLDELGRGYEHVTDPDSRAAIDFGVFGIPETFFIDRDGTVVGKVQGVSDLDLLSRSIEAIMDGRRPESVNLDGYEQRP